jgi:hypothetical protein
MKTSGKVIDFLVIGNRLKFIAFHMFAPNGTPILVDFLLIVFIYDLNRNFINYSKDKKSCEKKF